VDIATNQVASDYFKMMQIPLLRGREFTDQDDKNSQLVMIVNETLARRYIVQDGDLEKASVIKFRCVTMTVFLSLAWLRIQFMETSVHQYSQSFTCRMRKWGVPVQPWRCGPKVRPA
jgi:hypothetical protein